MVKGQPLLLSLSYSKNENLQPKEHITDGFCSLSTKNAHNKEKTTKPKKNYISIIQSYKTKYSEVVGLCGLSIWFPFSKEWN